MPDIEIKRGYEVLPDNNVRFGIRVINNSDVIMSDVEVLLDYSESLFQLEGSKVQKLGTIPPSIPRTAKFIMKPLGCIHKENISATIIFKDHQWKKHTLEMRPKEVHCVCPFLKEKSIKRADFLTMLQSGFMEERGLNFEGISVDKLVDFLAHTCKNRLYKVDEFSIENGKILYLAGDAVGEKAYYLLTAVVKEYEGLTQVLLRASSDKSHGLTGFLNETLDNLRHLVESTSAREIGIIKKEQVINIIDSVVQRSNISMEGGAPEIKIKDSMVQRVDIKLDEERKRREEEIQGKIEAEKRENELQRKREEENSQRRQSEETSRMQREPKDEGAKKIPEAKYSLGKFLAVVLVLGVLALGYWTMTSGSNNTPVLQQPTPVSQKPEFIPEKSTPYPFPNPNAGQKNFTNSIGIEFVLIPAGEFDMGSTSEGQVQHTKISNEFYLGKYVVTQKQWNEVMESNPSNNKDDSLPVDSVSWYDVHEFIKRLNQKEGTNKYQLPTEAEWEYAAWAGTTNCSFGVDNLNLNESIKVMETKSYDPGPSKPNPWGLYDMYGNFVEWMQDGDNTSRVLRNGWAPFYNGKGIMQYDACRASAKGYNPPDFRSERIGFRLLRIL